MKYGLKYLHLSLSLLLAMTCLQARADGGDDDYLSNQAVGNSQERLLQKLADELSPAFKELTRDVYVYHWGSCQYQTQGDPAFHANDEYARESVQRLMLWTYRKDKHQGGMMGTSYYASTDPVATQGYGDCVSETRLPAKARFIDERRSVSLSYELRSLLRSEGCYASTFSQMLAHANSEPCHELATRLLLVLRVSAVAYSYSAAAAMSCRPSEHHSAFILVNPTLAGEKYTKVFNPSHEPEDGQREARSRLKGVANQFSNGWGGRTLWSGMPASSAVDDWIKEHIFGCDPDKYPEDKWPDLNAKKALPELDFAAPIPTWGILPPIGDNPADCCNIIKKTQPQDGVIRSTAAIDAVTQALLNSP
ncbi:MAG: hypothetical protein A2X94_00885 [Bdellovibrionales bacterium GWB1_55_8]|nr:MAG: hypothetical protein A2X94_00885 [Bdellovibrionales bacterium GWB1_55_8]